MHVHSSQMNINAVNPYLAAAEKAVAAQQAADVRKKLVQSVVRIDGGSNAEKAFMIGHWMESRQGRAQSADRYRPGEVG